MDGIRKQIVKWTTKRYPFLRTVTFWIEFNLLIEDKNEKYTLNPILILAQDVCSHSCLDLDPKDQIAGW